MSKTLIGVIFGGIFGSIITFFVFPIQVSSPQNASMPVVGDGEHYREKNDPETDNPRRDRHASINTIEDIIALPTQFAVTDALYAISGRATQTKISELIQQATQIEDQADRVRVLGVLLTRLTELDPHAALGNAREIMPGMYSPLENTVWTTWGRLDLAAAVNAGKEGNLIQKQIIAQALYTTIRDLSPEKLEIVQTTLGVKPDLGVLSRQLYALADKSTEAAEQFIESQDRINQKNLTLMLAQYTSRQDGVGDGTVTFSPGFASAGSVGVFPQMGSTMQGFGDPDAALKAYLENPGDFKNQMVFTAVLQSLVQSDPDKALGYLEKIPGRSNRSKVASQLMQAMARSDPQRALAWVRENKLSNYQGLLSQILVTIAQTDPQLAFTEAQSIKSRSVRGEVFNSIIGVLVHSSPEDAVKMLSQIDTPGERRIAITRLSSQWAIMDFNEATEWVTTLNAKEQKLAVQGMQQSLVHNNVDASISLLEKFPDANSSDIKNQIIQSLVKNHSANDALAFIERYEGTEEHSQLLQKVVFAAAYTDPDQAKQMLDTLPDVEHKDSLYVSVVSQKAADDPQTALLWMELITDQQQRQQTMSQVAMIWYSHDPDAAGAWLQNLPPSESRDSTILPMVSMMMRDGEDPLPLINTISDPAKLKQARSQVLPWLMYEDPERARALLSELDLSESELAEYEQIFQLYKNGNIRIED